MADITVNNSAVAEKSPPSLKGLLNNEEMKKKFQDMLGERTQGFFVSITNAVSSNSLLQKAEPNSIIMAAAVAASLDLPIDPNLGFSYLVPYNNKVKGVNGQPDTWKSVAQFQIGYRGFIQLSLRSGQFETINVSDVREGEIEGEDFLTGEIKFNWKNREERMKLPIIGYVSYFRLINGFWKSFYMSKGEAEAHGKKFSQTFKKGEGKWKDDFDSMAKKTVLKLLLSKFAPLSIQMQKAISADQGVIKNVDSNTIDVEYIDNSVESISIDQVESDKQAKRIADHINNAKTIEDLEQVIDVYMEAGLADLYVEKMDSLKAKSK